MVAAGVFLVVRAFPIFEAAPDVLTAMTWIGAVTAFLAACTAVVQDDIKKVLAYSTCSQLGFMVAALGTGSILGGYFHLTTHAFFKALLFLGAGAAIHSVHSNNIHDMGGLIKKTPFSAVMFIVGAAALAGIPGLAGFFSKDIILEELLHGGHMGPLVLLLVSAALTTFYMTRVVVIAFFGKPSAAVEHAHGAPLVMGAPMFALTLLAVAGGYMGTQLGALWGGTIAFHLTPVGMAASGLALAAVTYGVLLLRKGHQRTLRCNAEALHPERTRGQVLDRDLAPRPAPDGEGHRLDRSIRRRWCGELVGLGCAARHRDLETPPDRKGTGLRRCRDCRRPVLRDLRRGGRLRWRHSPCSQSLSCRPSWPQCSCSSCPGVHGHDPHPRRRGLDHLACRIAAGGLGLRH